MEVIKLSKISLIFFVFLFGSLALTACTNTTATEESVNNDWLTFESADVGIKFRYPSELVWTLNGTELTGIDQGYLRGYSFSGIVDDVEMSFYLEATSEDYGLGISEGCCWYYSGPALDLNQTDEEIMDDLTEDSENGAIVGDYSGKLLKAYNLEKLVLGSNQVLRFTSLAGFVGYKLSDKYLIPNPGGEFTNFVVTWRGSETFTNLEGELSYEEFFAQIDDLAENRMDDLTESEEKEKALIEEILSTLEFIDVTD